MNEFAVDIKALHAPLCCYVGWLGASIQWTQKRQLEEMENCRGLFELIPYLVRTYSIYSK